MLAHHKIHVIIIHVLVQILAYVEEK